MIKANSAGQYTLKMAIGDGDVQFGVRIVAPEGSPLCDATPDVMFTHLDTTAYFDSSGTMPWPNPIDVFTNVL